MHATAATPQYLNIHYASLCSFSNKLGKSQPVASAATPCVKSVDPYTRRSPLLPILDILAPVFLIILLGWWLGRSGFVSADAFGQLNRLVYWFGLPALLIVRIGAARPDFGDVSGLLAVFTATTLAGISAGWMTARLLRVPSPAVGTFVQGAFRGNLTFVGLPVVLYAFADGGAGQAGAQSSALLTFGPAVVLYNVLAVLVLIASAEGGGRSGGLYRASKGLLTNPILLSCIVGLLLSVLRVPLFNWLDRTLSALGQMALPLALLCIGGALYQTRLRSRIGWATAGAAIKVVLLPAVGLLLAWLIGLSPQHQRIAGILLACPTASTSYLLATQLKGDGALASSIIVVSYLLALPSLVGVLLLTN